MTTLPVYPRLGAEQQQSLLRSIISRCQEHVAAGRRAVVVFDLDGTVLENRPRSLRIFHEFGAALAARDDLSEVERDAAAKLQAATQSQLLYLVGDSMRSLGIHDAGLIEQIVEFWKARFFVDGYLHHDIEVPGAVAFAKACYEAGGNVVYFTGRDLPNMSLGSFASLRDLGFPIGVPGTALVCKPYFEMPDEEYKRNAGPQLAKFGEVVAVFDNEPVNCNVLLGMFEGVESVFLDTQHFPGAPALDPRVRILGDLDAGL